MLTVLRVDATRLHGIGVSVDAVVRRPKAMSSTLDVITRATRRAGVAGAKKRQVSPHSAPPRESPPDRSYGMPFRAPGPVSCGAPVWGSAYGTAASAVQRPHQLP